LPAARLFFRADKRASQSTPLCFQYRLSSAVIKAWRISKGISVRATSVVRFKLPVKLVLNTVPSAASTSAFAVGSGRAKLVGMGASARHVKIPKSTAALLNSIAVRSRKERRNLALRQRDMNALCATSPEDIRLIHFLRNRCWRNKAARRNHL